MEGDGGGGGGLYVTRVYKYKSANLMIWKTQYYMEVTLSIPVDLTRERTQKKSSEIFYFLFFLLYLIFDLTFMEYSNKR